MKIYLESFLDFIIGLFNDFKNIATNKPIITIIFPASGFGSLFIPDTLIVQPSNPVLEFIDLLTPYLKFVFLILTLVLTVVSLILQIKKLLKNKKSDDE